MPPPGEGADRQMGRRARGGGEESGRAGDKARGRRGEGRRPGGPVCPGPPTLTLTSPVVGEFSSNVIVMLRMSGPDSIIVPL